MPSNTQELLKTINGSLGTLSKSMGATEQRMYNKTLINIRGLEYDVSDKLIQNTHNTKILGDVKTDLDKILRSPGYKNAVVKFGKSYDVVSKIQNDWFSSIVEDFKPSGAVNVAQRTATREMVDNLIGGGVSQAVSQKVGNAILQNMQSGGTIAQVNNVIRELLIGDKSTPGRLTAYSGQIATDGINQYARAYNLQVTEDLGFDWYEYVGSTKDTTRPFCIEAVKQRWFHKSELGKASQGILRVGKVSTEGFYPDMTIDKFKLTCGGYRCGHQLRGTTEKRVPASIRNTIGFSKKGNAKTPVAKPTTTAKPTAPKPTTPKPQTLEELTVTGKATPQSKSDIESEGAIILKEVRQTPKNALVPDEKTYQRTVAQNPKLIKEVKVNGKTLMNKDNLLYETVQGKSTPGNPTGTTLRQLKPHDDLMKMMSAQSGNPSKFKVNFSDGNTSGAYYSPYDDAVNINVSGERWWKSGMHRRKAINHEYAHALSHKNGLIFNGKFPYKSYNYKNEIVELTTTGDFGLHPLLKESGDKAFKLIKSTRAGQKSLKDFDKMFGYKNLKYNAKVDRVKWKSFMKTTREKYMKLGYSEADVDDFTGTALDLMNGATKGSHGRGHGKLYWMESFDLPPSRQHQAWLVQDINIQDYSEFIAESSEYVYTGGNPIVDDWYPGLGKIFTEFWANVTKLKPL